MCDGWKGILSLPRRLNGCLRCRRTRRCRLPLTSGSRHVGEVLTLCRHAPPPMPVAMEMHLLCRNALVVRLGVDGRCVSSNRTVIRRSSDAWSDRRSCPWRSRPEATGVNGQEAFVFYVEEFPDDQLRSICCKHRQYRCCFEEDHHIVDGDEARHPESLTLSFRRSPIMFSRQWTSQPYYPHFHLA